MEDNEFIPKKDAGTENPSSSTAKRKEEKSNQNVVSHTVDELLNIVNDRLKDLEQNE